MRTRLQRQRLLAVAAGDARPVAGRAAARSASSRRKMAFKDANAAYQAQDYKKAGRAVRRGARRRTRT